MTLTLVHSPASGAAARGEHLGATWRPEVRASWRAYQLIFAEYEVPEAVVRRVAEAAYSQTQDWHTDLAEEIAGLAAGSGLALWQAAALTARSEVLAVARLATPGECSTSVFLPPSGAPRTVQTWDWHCATARTKLVWRYDVAGRTVTTFTEFGLLAKIGVNSTGLGLHFNMLQHDTDGGETGVPVHLLARRILDSASTVAEAEAIIRSAPVSASVALTVATYDGSTADACTFEVSPAGVARVSARPDGFVLHTNHFLDKELERGERLEPEEHDSFHRHAELIRRTTGLRSPDFKTRVQALRQHRHEGSALCRHPEDDSPWQTHVVVGLDVAHGRLLLRDGPPCQGGADAIIRV